VHLFLFVFYSMSITAVVGYQMAMKLRKEMKHNEAEQDFLEAELMVSFYPDRRFPCLFCIKTHNRRAHPFFRVG